MANNNTFEEAGIKLPTHVTAKEYFTVKKSDGSTVTKLPQELTDAEMRAASLGRSTVSPQFSYDNGKVKLSGGDKYINSDIVNSAAKTLQDYFKGKDLSNAQIAENFQKAIEGVNSMIEQNIQYQEYNDFLKSTGFSDEAYRNYALATQDASPTNSVNLLKSKNKYKGKKKDGSWDTLTATGWINYWKEAYNPEERAQLWMDASEALARANKKGATDDDLYSALPYILMGHKDSQNIPAQFLNMLNPFDEGGLDWEKDIKNAKVNIPVYGFDDTNSLSVFIQSALRQLAKRGLSATAGVLAFDNPWLELGATTGGQYFGIKDWDDNDLEEMSREDYQDYVKLAKDAIAQGFDTYDKMKDEYGEELAKKMWVVNSFAKVDPRAVGGGRVLDTIRNEKGEVVAEEGDYPGYKTYQDFQSRVAEWRKGRGGFETWTEEATQDIDKYVQQMSVYDPNSATFGVVSGQIASFVAEQAALGLISGGALTASNIANTLARGGWKLAGNALSKIALGQKLIAKAPSVANTLAALAQGGGKGWDAAKNLNAVAKAIYVVGEIGTWAVKEVGEDAIRGIIDDAVMRNSLDSQGNLDWNKFNENVYMNAVMAAIAHGGRGIAKGLASVVSNAATRNIDGVELNLSQRHQLNLLQKALDDQNNRIQFRGWDENNHPVITSYGKTKVLDQLTPPKEVMKALDEAASVVTPTAARAIEEVLEDEDVSDTVKQKLVEISEEKITDGDDIKTKIEEVLTDDEIREAFPDGTMRVGDDIIRIDTKEFTSGDVGRVSGREYKTMEEAIEGLKTAVKARDFSGSINAIMRFSVEAAKEFKQAVDDFADAHNMSERDVMKAIRDSRIAGQETIPGLQQLWDQSWNPLASKLLDLQEQLTGIRPTEHNFYFRDMVEGTFNPGVNGSYSINQGSVVDMLGGDSEFDLAASSTARNTGKLGEIAADKLEYDPEILMREYVASRMQTIWQSDDMGKVFATLQEAHDAGEFDLTEEQARVSIGATEKVASDVENSEGVQTIQDMTNVYELDETFGEEATTKPVDQSKPVSTSEENEVIQQSELKRLYGENKKTILDAQKKFNNSAKKSNAAELVSRNSGYSNRSIRADARAPIGVNYMPGDPFGPLGKWVNDNFIKGNSIVTQYSGYKADGTPTLMTISAYDGGYKMYAEAGSFARNVIIDVQNGDSLYDAIYKQVYNNGFFIEPSPSQIKRYGALKVKDQAASITDKIMDRIVKDERFNYVFDTDGVVKSTDGLLAILTTRFKGQGISDFTKFTRKVDWDSLTKGQKDWMNARMYEMTASVNKSTAHKIVDGLMRGAMALRYKSNMYWNFKNGQLQLTECQRAYTMNKIGDFASTIKRLTTDGDFRQKASDMTYVLAADSAGAGLSKTELEKATDAYTKLGAGSAISKDGILTDIDAVKAKFGDFDDAALASIHGGEYAKNYFLIAGFIAAGERQGLEGAELDAYVRNRFNVEALAGTKVGKIGLNDSRIGQFTFMYLGFPIRDLTLQIHAIKAGGTLGGDTKFKKFIGAADYMAKMLGAKGLMWAVEAPWGYSLMDQLNIDPFGVLGQYEQINTPYEDREPGWRVVDYLVRYNPLLQGAVTNTIADIYMSYRAAEEEARAEYMEEHDGSDEGFQWSIFQDGAENLDDIMRGLAPVGEAALGYIPGYTAYSRVAGEVNDLDRGYHLSESGNRLYETNTDLGNVMWGALTGRKNTANAQSYYQTPNPIRGLIDNGLAGLGQQFGRAINPFRGFREFDPVDTDTYEDWFDGSYQDQQNWNSGIYQFRDEAQQIKEKYDKYIAEGREVNSINARENELADLRARLEKYVEAYTAKHPDGINLTKQNQLIGILNMGGQRTLDEAFSQSQGEYTDEWDKAQARYSQGDFPTAYGMKQNSKGEISYGQSPQLEQVLSQQRYGISSDVAPVIEQMYKNTTMSTPAGDMTMKDYHDKIYSQLQAEWNKSKTDYDKVTKLQEGYLATISKNVIQPILNTYGSSVLSAGRSSDIMQEFGKMLYGMVPSDEYRLDKKGKKIYKSTPYMTIDIPAWLRKNFTKYQASVNSTNRETSQRLLAIRDSLDNGRTSTAKAKARALVQDIGNGKASVSRDELEWLQGVLND